MARYAPRVILFFISLIAFGLVIASFSDTTAGQSLEDTDTKTQSKSVEVLPMTLIGTGSYTRGGLEASNVCPAYSKITLSLEEDGTVSGNLVFNIMSNDCQVTISSGFMKIAGAHKDGIIMAGEKDGRAWLKGKYEGSKGSISGRKLSPGSSPSKDSILEINIPDLR